MMRESKNFELKNSRNHKFGFKYATTKVAKTGIKKNGEKVPGMLIKMYTNSIMVSAVLSERKN